MHILPTYRPLFTFCRNILLSFIFLCLLAHPAARAQDDGDFKVQLLPVTPQIEAAATKALNGCPPPPRGKIIGAINKNNVYTLSGDLFHNGSIYAFVDNYGDQAGGIILCQWRKDAWKPVFAINLDASWKFPDDYRARQGR